MADTVGIRPAVSGDLDLLWDVLAIAAHDPAAAAAPAVPMVAAHVAGWQRTGDFGLVAEPSGVAVRVVQVEAPGELRRAGLAARPSRRSCSSVRNETGSERGDRHEHRSQLEHAVSELCHERMSAKAATDGVFGPVQAAVRVFIFQALSAWTVLESTRPDRAAGARLSRTWLRRILEGEELHVRQVSSIKVSIPKH